MEQEDKSNKKFYREFLVAYSTSLYGEPTQIWQCTIKIDNEDNIGPMKILEKLKEETVRYAVLLNYWEI